MLFVMKRNYFPSRVALCGLCLVALLFVLAGCGGSSGVAANAPASMSTNTTTAGVENTAPSPTSIQPGVTPTNSRPSPTPTKAKPAPTPTRTTPTSTPTRATPSPTPKPPTPTPPPTTMKITIIDNGSFAFSLKFTQAGTFTYHCNIHPFMTASIMVK
jgi:hypothetical protein